MPVWRPEEGIGFPGAGVRQSELPDMGHGNKIRSSARAVQALPLSQLFSSLLFLFIGTCLLATEGLVLLIVQLQGFIPLILLFGSIGFNVILSGPWQHSSC